MGMGEGCIDEAGSSILFWLPGIGLPIIISCEVSDIEFGSIEGLKWGLVGRDAVLWPPFVKTPIDGPTETLFYCWRMHMGNYSRVVMVITSENNEFITSGRRPRVINSLFHEWLPSPQVNNLQYAWVNSRITTLIYTSWNSTTDKVMSITLLVVEPTIK